MVLVLAAVDSVDLYTRGLGERSVHVASIAPRAGPGAVQAAELQGSVLVIW